MVKRLTLTNRTEQRCNQLFEMGLKFNGAEHVKDDFNVHWTEIICSSDKEWNEIISNIKNEMKERM